MYARRQCQELRAELKPREFGSIEIELEPHPAVLDEHVRNPAKRGEVVYVADRQHRRPFHNQHDGGRLSRCDA